MPNTKLQSANKHIVADRAGTLIKAPLEYSVQVQSAGDRVLIGFLPAGHKLDIGATRIFAKNVAAALAAQAVVVCIGTGVADWDGDANTLYASTAITANTEILGTAATTFALGETLGVSTNNRPVYLYWPATPPASAAGLIRLDLAYYAPGT